MNKPAPHSFFLCCATLLLCLLLPVSLPALEPPRAGELDQLRQAGLLEQRVQDAARFGNHLTRPDLVQHLREKLARLAGQPVSSPDSDLMGEQLLWGMPSSGTNKVLILLIDFPEYAHSVSYATMSNMVLGTGNPANYPRESLKSYYMRSSYSNLVIEGTVLDWYTLSHSRTWYTDTYGEGNNCNLEIIKEAVDFYDTSIDYSQFDNNNDGQIDYFVVFWTGPTGPWASFWWGYMWSLFSDNLSRDGVRFYSFSWQWESDRPTVVIHETGHALGLPDYYDYDGNVGPDGGVGGLDMMDANRGDHNAFSKFMLGWIEPTYVVTNMYDYQLRASAQYPEAAVIMPEVSDESQAFDEYFMVQNRYRTLNDSGSMLPGNGLMVWHVDATPTWPGGTSFKYNNSYSTHKLLRLMEADGLEEIERGGSGDAGDFYTSAKSLSPGSSPNSDSYAGVMTGVTITDISANSLSMTADLLLEVPMLELLNTNIFLDLNTPQHSVIITNSGSYPLSYYVSRISQVWLTASPSNATLAAHGTTNLVISANGDGLEARVHYASVYLKSNDPRYESVRMYVDFMVPEPATGFLLLLLPAAMLYRRKTTPPSAI